MVRINDESAARQITSMGAACLALAALGAMAPQAKAAPLSWGGCMTTSDPSFDCATAQAPLDYANPSGSQINLYVIRHYATDQAHRIGTLFFNPGGPGGPGSTDLPGWLHFFPTAVRARFDIVSWDPRGVGLSTAVLCFKSQKQEDNFFAGIPASFPVSGAEQTAWISRYAAYAEQCLKRNGALLAHVSTADTARDLDMLRQAVGSPSLNYLGVSYGTFLGAVYANLFPQNVGGVVLDGNVDPIAYTNGTNASPLLSTSLRLGSDIAAGRTLNSFLDLCGEAGPARCPFAGTSAAATRSKFATLLQRLKRQPVVIGGVTLDYATTLDTTNAYLFTVQAAPGFYGWVHAATTYQTLWEASVAGKVAPASAAAIAQAFPPAKAPYISDRQSSAIECPEAPNERPPAAFRRLATFAFVRSGPLGPVESWGDEACASWKAVAAQPYNGPWNHPTAHPILVIGNTGDPSTPYEGSVAMATELASARLLTVNGYGHTTLLNPSECANRYEAAYLINGRLPPAGMVCAQDKAPFQ